MIDWQKIFSILQGGQINQWVILMFVLFIGLLFFIGILFSFWFFRSEFMQIYKHSLKKTNKFLLALYALVFSLVVTIFVYIGYRFMVTIQQNTGNKPIVIHGNFQQVRTFQNFSQQGEQGQYTFDYEIYLQAVKKYYLSADGQLTQWAHKEEESFTILQPKIISHIEKNIQPGESIYWLFTSEGNFKGLVSGKKVFFYR